MEALEDVRAALGLGLCELVRIGSKRRDAEVAKTRPVAELRTESGVNERAGEGAENGIGSPSETKGISRSGDTGKTNDSKWATQIGLKSPSPFWAV